MESILRKRSNNEGNQIINSVVPIFLTQFDGVIFFKYSINKNIQNSKFVT